MSKRSVRAADKFLLTHVGINADTACLAGKPTTDIVRLVQTAFLLYEAEWNCHDHHISHWEWPYHEWPLTPYGIDHPGELFGTNEPWTVLFRKALDLHTRCTALRRANADTVELTEAP